MTYEAYEAARIMAVDKIINCVMIGGLVIVVLFVVMAILLCRRR